MGKRIVLELEVISAPEKKDWFLGFHTICLAVPGIRPALLAAMIESGLLPATKATTKERARNHVWFWAIRRADLALWLAGGVAARLALAEQGNKTRRAV